MRLGKIIAHNKPAQDDKLIPLINIVFLMLIFFMVAGHISASEPIKVQPPDSVSKQPSEQKALTVVVSREGEIAVGQQRVTDQELTALITNHFRQAENPQAFRILVKVDAGLAVEKLQQVLGLIRQTGIKRIALATQKQAAA
ncbi:MAG: biopolymer transporter ExbD [Methylophaga sp.]|jgi:biopolymer transport protein ExbD